jgi:hypothetical protein
MSDEDRPTSADDEPPRKKRRANDARPAATARSSRRPSRDEDDEDQRDDENDEDEENDEENDAEPENDLLANVIRVGTPFAPLIVLIGAVALGFLRGPGAALLVLAAGGLLAMIAAFWKSIRILIGEELLPEEALALEAPSAEEEQKRAVLRALKDLEYEYKLGKVSEDDYQMLSVRYRAEARKLLRSLDDRLSPARQKAEEIVAREIGAAVPAAPASSKGKKGAKTDKKASSSKQAPKAEPAEKSDEESDEENPS